MKITVVRDQSGKTTGTIEAPASASGPTVAPVLEAGITATELEVAQNYRENLKELYK